jgi:aspartokinase
MNIDLNEEMHRHLVRVRNLADDAADDMDEKMAGKAAAMSTMTNLLKEITKTQESIYNMERLQKIEQALIEAAQTHLNEEQLHLFLADLEQRLTIGQAIGIE